MKNSETMIDNALKSLVSHVLDIRGLIEEVEAADEYVFRNIRSFLNSA